MDPSDLKDVEKELLRHTGSTFVCTLLHTEFPSAFEELFAPLQPFKKARINHVIRKE